MKTRWSLAVLTMANLVVLICSLVTMRPAAAQGPPPVLRGRGLEIVDDVILEAKDSSSSLKLRNEDGREQVVKP